jgi:CrcB protein
VTAPAHLVGLGGALGALARHAVGQVVDAGQYPWATFVVNVVGSFVLGLVTFAGTPSEVRLLVGTGACGSFTTFSSFAVETVQLWEAGDRLPAAVNAVGTLGAALLGVGGAWLLAGAL